MCDGKAKESAAIVAVSTKIDVFTLRAREHQLPAATFAAGHNLIHEHVEL
jgi:hypothetical protein